MAAITGAALAVAGSAYGANRASAGAKDAARAQQRGTDASIAEQRRQFDAMMQMTQGRRDVEGQALNQLAQLTGLPGQGGSGPAGSPDYSAFYNSPDYQFALQQGEQSTLRNASALGNVRSGNTLAALTRYGQGAATQNFGNYINRLQGLAGMGATDQAANMMMQQGQNVGNNLIGGANARASGIAGSANAWSGFANQLGQLGGYAMQQWGQPKAPQPYGGYGQQQAQVGYG